MKLLLAGRRGQGEVPLSADGSTGDWLRQVEQWFHDACAGEWMAGARVEPGPHDSLMLRLRLHPAASDLSIVAASEGRIVVSAETSAVGPGYHRYLCDHLRNMGDAHGIFWADPDEGAGVGDATGYFHSANPASIEPGFLAWLHLSIGRLLRRRSVGESGLTLSLPPGHDFEHPGALLTPLGPRDEPWMLGVLEDPSQGRDVFPWWEPTVTARVRLGRALCRLWTDVMWRPPLLDDERRLLRDVARTLQLAWREDPSLPYPWRAWQEVLGYLGMGGTLAEEVHRRAGASAGGPPLGYRRGTLRVDLPGGWRVRVPGSFSESRLEDGSWVARDHRRSVRVLTMEDADAGAPEPSGAERHALDLEHQTERVTSRASLHLEPGLCRLMALYHAGTRRAVGVVSFDDPDEQDWALETWRSVDFAAP
ncbi:hypothetical protein KRR26_09250 [Corallococcus sp. M34]|uniref:hypothetical protein n=1 Tax=Citreicoccus inhibens TaxID=2849499 RepID=UPI001C23510A|nr:hypothetical protein [Citreicoccus inhibens]MBU8895790.1 hypothetical protein [Citreicoccus inhibens]